MRAIAVLVLLIPSLLHCSEAKAQAALEVEVVLSRPNAGGVVRLALCPGKESFETEQDCVVREGEVRGGTVIVRFDALQVGQHALKAFHDIDRNGKLNTNWFGFPTEPYGFGNNARRPTGPPTFEMSAIRLGPGITKHRILLE